MYCMYVQFCVAIFINGIFCVMLLIPLIVLQFIIKMLEKLLTNSLPSQIQLNFNFVIPKSIDCTTYWGAAEVL